MRTLREVNLEIGRVSRARTEEIARHRQAIADLNRLTDRVLTELGRERARLTPAVAVQPAKRQRREQQHVTVEDMERVNAEAEALLLKLRKVNA